MIATLLARPQPFTTLSPTKFEDFAASSGQRSTLDSFLAITVLHSSDFILHESSKRRAKPGARPLQNGLNSVRVDYLLHSGGYERVVALRTGTGKHVSVAPALTRHVDSGSLQVLLRDLRNSCHLSVASDSIRVDPVTGIVAVAIHPYGENSSRLVDDGRVSVSHLALLSQVQCGLQ